ncbi:fungal-specific transcription factor domain-containing protein [Dactylonectria macrodidyma]|uniref:Fungal-specific transcription factor domain-containing protein n=1 Tax=Dactylonectria macrodidyma TaxID=307937 RepID=A0A9P9IQF3_9HYPO|nr:fungal-specific transcription factor domain-containing protein [Dactylonectria macrodidyma]
MSVSAMDDPASAEDASYSYDVDLGPEVDASNRVHKLPSAKAKKRASRACLPCRSRKVRCILTSSAEPCINCRLDDKECVFIARSKFSRGTSRHAPVASKEPSSAAPPGQDVGSFGDDLPSNTDEQPSLAVDPVPLDGALPSLPPDLGDYGNESIDDLDLPQLSAAFPESLFPDCPWAPQEGTQRLLFDPTNPDYSILEAPKVHTLSPEDLDYLYKQGCFVVPQRNILNEFIQQYFLHIHPMLPMLNEADFWALYHPQNLDDTYGDRMPLIVIQGILFTSCSFVSKETIETLGFKSVHDAKSSFYKRAKLIYDFGLETSSISIAHAALLLSHSHLIPLPHGGCKHLGPMWLGIAMHYARDAGAHRYQSISTSGAPVTPQQKKLGAVLKRLWWCCIIRDRLMPLTSRRTIKITHSNFNFTGNQLLTAADLAEEFEKSSVYDPTTKRFLAEILEKLVELCVILTEVLTLTFPMHDDPSRAPSHPVTEESRIGDCRMALKRWYSTVLRIQSTPTGNILKDVDASGPSNSSPVLFINLLEMYYHSARMALCHYEILYCSLAPPLRLGHLDTVYESTHELQGAVAQVTQCLRKLVRLRLDRWLPISAVGCTAFPLALQILDVKLFNPQTPNQNSNSPSFAQYKQQQLNVLIEAMKTYRPRYDGVDWVARTVRFIVDLAQQHLTAIRTQHGNSISSWTDILQLQPKYYLRLAMTMDLSIRNGKLPQESDFPQSLRGIFEHKLLVPPPLNPHYGLTNFGSPVQAGARIEPVMSEKGSPEEELPRVHQHLRESTAFVPGDEAARVAQNPLDFDDRMWEASSGTPTTNPKGTESIASGDEGQNHPVMELDYGSVLLSSPGDAGMFGNERRESGGSCSLAKPLSPGLWETGLSIFEAANFGNGADDSVLERLLEI